MVVRAYLGELGQVHLCCSNPQFPQVQRKKSRPIYSRGRGKHQCGHEKPGQRKEVLRLPMNMYGVPVPAVGGPEPGEGAISVFTELGGGRCREQHTESERRGYSSSSWLQIKDKIGMGEERSFRF